VKITLCGSFKNKELLDSIAQELVSRGHFVYGLGLLPFHELEGLSDGLVSNFRLGATLNSFSRIKKSDLILIVNPNGYSGVSVSMELGVAVAADKPVFALFDDQEKARHVLFDKVLNTDSPSQIADCIETCGIN
jgi:nucleoside 2-deoxyribosyltransferase